MTKVEIEMLESLFHKLEGYMKHPIALCSGIHDSINVGIYSYGDNGKIIDSTDSATLLKSIDALRVRNKIEP